MAHPDPEHVTSILITHLEGNSEGLDVGLSIAPEAAAYPYLVVDPLAPFGIDGPLNSVNELQVLDYQIMSVGLTMQQAMGGIAAARDRLLGASLPDFSAASYSLAGDIQIEPAGGGAQNDLEDKPPLFLYSETYRMTLVPA